MTRELLLARRDYFSLVHGVTVRVMAAFTDHGLDFRPQPGLRTPRELIFHIYARQLYVYLRLLGKEPPNLYDY